MKEIPPPFRKWDGLFLGTVITISLIMMFLIARIPETPGLFNEVVITDVTGKITCYSLSESSEREVIVSGPLGVTTILISVDGARFTSSPCPNKICIQSGIISKPHDSAACIPNKVILAIKSHIRTNSKYKIKLQAETVTNKPPIDGLTR